MAVCRAKEIEGSTLNSLRIKEEEEEGCDGESTRTRKKKRGFEKETETTTETFGCRKRPLQNRGKTSRFVAVSNR